MAFLRVVAGRDLIEKHGFNETSPVVASVTSRHLSIHGVQIPCTVRLPRAPEDGLVRVELFATDAEGKADDSCFLGRVNISLTAFAPRVVHSLCLPLEKRSERSRVQGTARVALWHCLGVNALQGVPRVAVQVPTAADAVESTLLEPIIRAVLLSVHRREGCSQDDGGAADSLGLHPRPLREALELLSWWQLLGVALNEYAALEARICHSLAVDSGDGVPPAPATPLPLASLATGFFRRLYYLRAMDQGGALSREPPQDVFMTMHRLFTALATAQGLTEADAAAAELDFIAQAVYPSDEGESSLPEPPIAFLELLIFRADCSSPRDGSLREALQRSRVALAKGLTRRWLAARSRPADENQACLQATCRLIAGVQGGAAATAAAAGEVAGILEPVLSADLPVEVPRAPHVQSLLPGAWPLAAFAGVAMSPTAEPPLQQSAAIVVAYLLVALRAVVLRELQAYMEWAFICDSSGQQTNTTAPEQHAAVPKVRGESTFRRAASASESFLARIVGTDRAASAAGPDHAGTSLEKYRIRLKELRPLCAALVATDRRIGRLQTAMAAAPGVERVDEARSLRPLAQLVQPWLPRFVDGWLEEVETQLREWVARALADERWASVVESRPLAASVIDVWEAVQDVVAASQALPPLLQSPRVGLLAVRISCQALADLASGAATSCARVAADAEESVAASWPVRRSLSAGVARMAAAVSLKAGPGPRAGTGRGLLAGGASATHEEINAIVLWAAHVTAEASDAVKRLSVALHSLSESSLMLGAFFGEQFGPPDLALDLSVDSHPPGLGESRRAGSGTTGRGPATALSRVLSSTSSASAACRQSFRGSLDAEEGAVGLRVSTPQWAEAEASSVEPAMAAHRTAKDQVAAALARVISTPVNLLLTCALRMSVDADHSALLSRASTMLADLLGAAAEVLRDPDEGERLSPDMSRVLRAVWREALAFASSELSAATATAAGDVVRDPLDLMFRGRSARQHRRLQLVDEALDIIQEHLYCDGLGLAVDWLEDMRQPLAEARGGGVDGSGPGALGEAPLGGDHSRPRAQPTGVHTSRALRHIRHWARRDEPGGPQAKPWGPAPRAHPTPKANGSGGEPVDPPNDERSIAPLPFLGALRPVATACSCERLEKEPRLLDGS